MKNKTNLRTRLADAVAQAAASDQPVSVAVPSVSAAVRCLSALCFDVHHYTHAQDANRLAGATFEGEPFRLILSLP